MAGRNSRAGGRAGRMMSLRWVCARARRRSGLCRQWGRRAGGSQQLAIILVVAVAAEEGVVLEVARPLVGRDAHEVVPSVALVTADPGLTRAGLVPGLQADLAHGACRHTHAGSGQTGDRLEGKRHGIATVESSTITILGFKGCLVIIAV